MFLAGLTKKDLPRKHYRHLSNEEVNVLNYYLGNSKGNSGIRLNKFLKKNICN